MTLASQVYLPRYDSTSHLSERELGDGADAQQRVMPHTNDRDVLGPANSLLVCGTTRLSWRDQIETIGTGETLLSSRLSLASHALPGRICARQWPKYIHASTL